MAHATRFYFSLLSLGVLVSAAQADVGVLDKYECHEAAQTGEYHCHGSAADAKLGGIIVSADARVQAWSTSANELYLFAGVAANAEYNHKWFGLTGSYFYMPLVSGVDGNNVTYDDTVVQSGWDAGIKFGPGVGRIGTKIYMLAGWSGSAIVDAGNAANNGDLGGYYVGAGFGTNTSGLTLDASAVYRDPSSYQDYLFDLDPVEQVDVLAFDVRVSAGWRF